MVDALGLVLGGLLCESSMCLILVVSLDFAAFDLIGGHDVMRAQIKATQRGEGDFTVEPKAGEADGSNFVSFLIESLDLGGVSSLHGEGLRHERRVQEQAWLV